MSRSTGTPLRRGRRCACTPTKRASRPSRPDYGPARLAQFPNDIQAIRRYAERDHANIVSWNVYDRGSHYAAHQASDLLIADLRTFFTSLR